MSLWSKCKNKSWPACNTCTERKETTPTTFNTLKRQHKQLKAQIVLVLSLIKQRPRMEAGRDS